MNTIKKNTLNALAAILILSSATFAEGDMGGGGFTSYDQTVKVGDTRTPEGDMGGGGRIRMTEEPTYFDELILTISDYLETVF